MTTPPRVACPCCGHFTLHASKSDEICPVCYWQDDGQDNETASEVWGGPNKDISLAEARENFKNFQAGHRDWLPHVRPAKENE